MRTKHCAQQLHYMIVYFTAYLLDRQTSSTYVKSGHPRERADGDAQQQSFGQGEVPEGGTLDEQPQHGQRREKLTHCSTCSIRI